MDDFTIKDLENLSGIKAHTIRIWEQRYSFLKPQRSNTNIRYYSNLELKTILNISLLNKYGYKISRIDKMSEAEVQDKIVSITETEAKKQKVVNDLIVQMVDLNLNKIELILDEYIAAKGIEETITQIIFSFLERIGILWVTNHINPAQEHLITNIIRQKLIVGIDGIKKRATKHKTAILFLPEGEYHEIGLLFINFLLKNRGISILYLGANVPINDLEFVTKLKQPDFLFCHLTSIAHHFNFEKFIINIHKKIPRIPIFFSGHPIQAYKNKIPSNINFKKSLLEVTDFIKSL